jgi:hypothetical protein
MSFARQTEKTRPESPPLAWLDCSLDRAGQARGIRDQLVRSPARALLSQRIVVRESGSRQNAETIRWKRQSAITRFYRPITNIDWTYRQHCLNVVLAQPWRVASKTCVAATGKRWNSVAQVFVGESGPCKSTEAVIAGISCSLSSGRRSLRKSPRVRAHVRSVRSMAAYGRRALGARSE